MWMTITLRYFNFWGFCTEFNLLNRRRNGIPFILIFYSVFGIIATDSFLQHLKRWRYDTLGTVNDTVKLIGALLVYWSSIIESFSKRKIQQQFWEIYRSIETEYCTERTRIPWIFLWKFLTYIPIITIIYAFQYTDSFLDAPTDENSFWITYATIMTQNQNRAFYYLFYLEIIKFELTIIEQEVREVVQSIQVEIDNKIRRNFEVKRLKWIREYYLSVYELCECVNNVFGWSNVATVLYLFQVMLYHLNYIYWKWYNTDGVFYVQGLFVESIC